MVASISDLSFWNFSCRWFVLSTCWPIFVTEIVLLPVDKDWMGWTVVGLVKEAGIPAQFTRIAQEWKSHLYVLEISNEYLNEWCSKISLSFAIWSSIFLTIKINIYYLPSNGKIGTTYPHFIFPNSHLQSEINQTLVVVIVRPRRAGGGNGLASFPRFFWSALGSVSKE